MRSKQIFPRYGLAGSLQTPRSDVPLSDLDLPTAWACPLTLAPCRPSATASGRVPLHPPSEAEFRWQLLCGRVRGARAFRPTFQRTIERPRWVTQTSGVLQGTGLLVKPSGRVFLCPLQLMPWCRLLPRHLRACYWLGLALSVGWAFKCGQLVAFEAPVRCLWGMARDVGAIRGLTDTCAGR